ncbi:hypothetical protein D3C80_1393790 [compost metagenome]
MLVGTIQMNKGEIAADIPGGFVMTRHDAKAIRAAAVLPPPWYLLIALITIRHVQAEGVVIGTFLGDTVVAVGPGRQLHARAQLHAVVQPGFMLVQCFKCQVCHSCPIPVIQADSV